ncbi:uncharacterized protein LOC134539857 [Bacillus rossius redtenbacheri]|uniref:uncharacterized protein LOC134539857 n=1 Tax=Bacillus rossius redtenbacheri TaxID=93214 RepID=UPI002FDDDF8A
MERIFIPDVLSKASQEKCPVKSPDNVDYSEKEVCVQKRPVGRPRKNRLPAAEEGQSSQGTPKRKRASASPRKRGRPSKQPRKLGRPVVPKAEPGEPPQEASQGEEAEERPCDQFGKYVAAELAQLPQREAILLQQEIQSCITRCKLSCLGPELPAYGQYAEQLIVDVSPSASPASVDDTYASDASGRAFHSFKLDEK